MGIFNKVVMKKSSLFLAMSTIILVFFVTNLAEAQYSWSPTFVLPQNVKITTESPEGTKHVTPMNTSYSSKGGKTGLIAHVEKPEESMFQSADITAQDKYKKAEAGLTRINVVKRWNKDTIELGVGTKVQLEYVTDSSGKQRLVNLLGGLGTHVTLQPNASVIWNGMDMSPEGNKPVTFRIGLKEEKLIIEEIEGGYLKFARKGEEGGIVNGILVQTENGVVERIVNH